MTAISELNEARFLFFLLGADTVMLLLLIAVSFGRKKTNDEGRRLSPDGTPKSDISTRHNKDAKSVQLRHDEPMCDSFQIMVNIGNVFSIAEYEKEEWCEVKYHPTQGFTLHEEPKECDVNECRRIEKDADSAGNHAPREQVVRLEIAPKYAENAIHNGEHHGQRLEKITLHWRSDPDKRADKIKHV